MTWAAPELPTGVLTFLLTDVVGSVPLWERAPEAMNDALILHDRLMTDVVHAHGGVLVRPRGEGDSTFNVFERAPDAADAAVAALRMLAEADWPPEAPIVVRMAMHTGEALGRDGDYYGRAVNRAARLRGLAAGGECVLSATTAALIEDHVAPPSVLIPRGTQALRGMDRPESVFLLSPGVVPRRLDDAVAAETETVTQPPIPDRLVAASGAVFVGRLDERRALEMALRPSDGAPTSIFLRGEAGIGKTALVAQLARHAHAAGAFVLYGRCPDDAGMPYAPWVEAIDRLVTATGDALLELLGPTTTGALATLIPAVADRRPDADVVGSDAEAQRYLLFQAIVGTLGTLARTAPVVVVVDDLHWADPPTLQLLHHVIEHARGAITVFATVRDTDVVEGGATAQLLAAMHREPNARVMDLAGLDRDETEQLVSESAGHELDEAARAFSSALQRETRGNPFFAVEVLRNLAETGRIRQDARGRWVAAGADPSVNLPDSGREIVIQRVARVGDSARETLTSAAVIGEEFEIETLAGAVLRDVDAVLDDLEEAERSALVAMTPRGTFQFAHALVGHALYEDLPAVRRGRIHRRVAEALEARDAEARLGDLARHWGEAVPPDADRAIGYAMRAGASALDTLAPAEALRWYREASRRFTDRGASEPGLEAEILVGLGTAQRRTGDRQSRETLLHATALARDSGARDALVRGAIENHRGFAALVGSVDDERVDMLQAALDAVGPDDTTERARLLAILANELQYGEAARRRAVADDALAVARRVDDPPTLVHVLNAFASAIWSPDTVDERRAAAQEARALAIELDDRIGEFWACTHEAITRIERAELAPFDACLAQKSAIAAEIGDPMTRWLTGWQESYRRLLAGDLAGAEMAAGSAFRIGNAAGQPDAFMLFGSQLLSIRAQQGRRYELIDATEAAANDAPGIHGFKAALALGYVEAERYDDAGIVLEQAFEQGFDIPKYALWFAAMLLWSQAASALDHEAACAVLYERLSPYPRYAVFSGSAVLGTTPCSLGALARVLGHLDDAEQHLDTALDVAHELDAPFFVAEAQVELARVLHLRGRSADREQAQTLVADARELAATRGFDAIRRAADRLPT